MATQADVRRIAMSLPGAQEEANRFAFSVSNKGKLKGFAWVWLERLAPKHPRKPNPGVLAVRVANLSQKDLMIAADPVKFFTEPHYNGFPAVLVRLDAVTVADLRMLITEAWQCQAPAELAKPPTRAAKPTGPKRAKAKATKLPKRPPKRGSKAS
jgi:hypothetical protein